MKKFTSFCQVLKETHIKENRFIFFCLTGVFRRGKLVVKVIWHKGRIADAYRSFTSIRQVAPMYTPSNSWFTSTHEFTPQASVRSVQPRAGFKCAEALGRIITRGPYPPPNAIIYIHLQLVAWHSGRTSVSDWRTFPVLRSTCSWWVTTNVGKPSAIGQPTRPTQPFILSGSINE